MSILEKGVQGKAQPKIIFTVDDLAQQKPMEWLLPGLLPRYGLSRLFGESNAGKTFLALSWALDLACSGVNVVYIVSEGRNGFWSRVDAWLKHNGRKVADIRPHIRFILEAVPFLKPGAPNTFIEALGQFRPELTIGDTLTNCLEGAAAGDEAAINAALENSKRWATEFEGAFLWLHHPGHSEKKRARGAYSAYAAMEMEARLDTVGPKDDDRRLLVCTKMRDDDLFTPKNLSLARLHGSRVMLDKGDAEIEPARGPGRPSKVDGAVTWLIDLLAKGPLPRKDVMALAASTEWSASSIDRAAKEVASGDGGIWRLRT